MPDNAENYYSDYKSVTITYTSEGGDLGYALYDQDMDFSGVSGDGSEPGKHPDWSKALKESKGKYSSISFNVTDECVGGVIRGVQIFCPDEVSDTAPITITVKSIKFNKELSANPNVPVEVPGTDIPGNESGSIESGSVEKSLEPSKLASNVKSLGSSLNVYTSLDKKYFNLGQCIQRFI